jgi:antitoxin MazE
MRTNIIRIGNSQGIRIPKVLLQQSRLGTEVELEVVGERIVIRAVSRPREGWEEKFRALADQEAGGDVLIDNDLTGTSDWDKEEWEW